MKLLYLATPYSKYEEGLEAAFKMACDNAAFLLERGVPVFSPIAHTHSIAKSTRVDPRDHEFWLDFDWPILTKCSGLIVVKAPGWEESLGIKKEIEHFYNFMDRSAIFYMEPLTMPTNLRKWMWA
jgi:hypothetical protein